jgi:hypothetical protein
MTCPGCDLPPPTEYCWAGHPFDCPLDMPPRWVYQSAPALQQWKAFKNITDCFKDEP